MSNEATASNASAYKKNIKKGKTKMTQGERQRTTWNDHERNQNNKEHRGTKTSTNDKTKRNKHKKYKKGTLSQAPPLLTQHVGSRAWGVYPTAMFLAPPPAFSFLFKRRGMGPVSRGGWKHWLVLLAFSLNIEDLPSIFWKGNPQNIWRIYLQISLKMFCWENVWGFSWQKRVS